MDRYWEADTKDRTPSENDMEKWIRRKYEDELFAMEGDRPTDPSTLDSDDEEETRKPNVETPPAKPSLSATPIKQEQNLLNLDSFPEGPSSSSATPATNSHASADHLDDLFTTPTTSSLQQDNYQDHKYKILSHYNTPYKPPIHQQPQQTLPSYLSNMLSYPDNMSSYQHQLSSLSSAWSSNGKLPPVPPANPNFLSSQPFPSTQSIASRDPNAQSEEKKSQNE